MREAQARCNAQEFAEWVAEYSIDPWGEERADLRSAIVAMVIANANRGKGQPAYKVEQFMPKYDRQHKQQTPEQMKALLTVMANTMNRKQELERG